MGRYYSGDIEGKFWFAVQSSADADFFGVTGYQPEYLEYNFDEDNIPDVEKGIAECKKSLGKYKVLLDKFFKKHDGYRDEMIAKEFKISVNKVKELLGLYARLDLGEKILKCLKKNGECNFQAEC